MGNYEVLARRFAEANLRVEVIERQIQSVSRWSSGASASDVFQMTILGHRREEFFRMWPGARTNRVEAEGIDRDRGQLVLMVHEPERTFEERLPKRRVNPDPAKVTVVREDKLWPKALPRHLRFHDLRGTTARCSPAPAFRWSSRSGCCAMRTRGSPRTSTRAWSWGIFAPASRDCRRLDPRSLDF